MTRQVVDAILSMPEYNRFTKGIYGWVGYETKWLEYENIERKKGETKWSFWKLFVYSIEGITSFSTAPLALAALMGVLFCILAFVFLIFIWARAMIFGDKTSGWPSLVCIIPADQWRAILLYGHSWTVSCQDLSGGKTQADLSD